MVTLADATVVKALLAFVAVNLDEFVVLVVFFSQAVTRQFTVWHVIYGQLIGFTIVLLISLLGALLGTYYVPMTYVSLIGLLPLGMGFYDLYKVVGFWTRKCLKSRQSASAAAADSKTTSKQGYYQIEMVGDGSGHDVEVNSPPTDTDTDDSDNGDGLSDSDSEGVLVNNYRHCCEHFLNVRTLAVSAVIIGDGGEEVGVFLPLLASQSQVRTKLVTVLTLYVLIMLQCGLAYAVVHHSSSLLFCGWFDESFASTLSRYSKNFMPFLLIGLGCYVLKDSILFH
jgi:cadmium resistance protein CadD (predicted permease)